MTKQENPYAYVSFEAPPVSDAWEETGLRLASYVSWKEEYPDVFNVRWVAKDCIRLIFLVKANTVSELEDEIFAIQKKYEKLGLLEVEKHNCEEPAASLPQEVAL